MEAPTISSLRSAIAPFGRQFVRYALAVILIWVGALKFAAYEAEAVQALTSESPLLSWVYDIFSVDAFARILGVVEILAGIGIALRPIVPLWCLGDSLSDVRGARGDHEEVSQSA